MSEPEIARRCLACGAASRERSSYCPECGHELGQKAVETDVSAPNATAANPAGETINLSEVDPAVPSQPDEPLKPPVLGDSSPSEQTLSEGDDAVAVYETFEPAEGDSLPKPQPEKSGERVRSFVSQRPAMTQGARDKIHRATLAAREIEDDVLHKVEKIRKMSTVVFDEAAYDPSVRFLLVAGALFALFLVIVVLNKMIG
ncbi:MAG TPA: hypothetical protein VJ124_18150 [Pyrinomonadaceae bacterium]|nr:hypothetical protein [Pyrinomonadaceae bacterium]